MTTPLIDPERTDRLSLPLIQPGQSSKHITHNEAVADIDALLHLYIDAQGVNAPPETGGVVTVGTEPSGIFEGHAGEIAFSDARGWNFMAPRAGMRAVMAETMSLQVHDGANWQPVSGGDASGSTDPETLGINTGADTTNRLSVKSEAILFAADDTSDAPTGDIRITANRDGGSDVAAFLFKTAYAADAEFGMLGNTNFTLKTADDTGVLATRLAVDPAGRLGLGTDTPRFALDLDTTDASVTRLAVTNRADSSGSGAGIAVYAGPSERFSLIQYPSGTAYLTTVGHLRLQAGNGHMLRFNSGSQEVLRMEDDVMTAYTPVRLANFAPSQLPDPAQVGAGTLAYLTGAGAGPVISDGSQWRALPMGDPI